MSKQWKFVQDPKFRSLGRVLDEYGDEIEVVAALSSRREVAHCHLIAAAPELLETLKLLTDEMALNGLATRLVARARADIAKAEGRIHYDFETTAVVQLVRSTPDDGGAA